MEDMTLEDMTLEEYASRIKGSILSKIDDKKYVDKLDSDIQKSYESSIELRKLLGYTRLDVDGYVMGILMLYPDLP